MLDLSPTKLIIVFIVVIVLLGPKRLPQVARQLGSGWRKLVGFQQQIERELRQTMPDMPSSADIVRFARSPVTILNQLADLPNTDAPVEDPGAPAPGDRSTTAPGEGADAAVDAGSSHWPEDPASEAALRPLVGAPDPGRGRDGDRDRDRDGDGVVADLRALATDDPAMN